MNSTGKGGFGERKQQINRKGRPKTFDALRSLAQQIAHKELPQKDGSFTTVAELILTGWATSREPSLQIKFVEYAWGKVPQAQEVSGPGGKPIEHKDVTLTDEERADRIARILDEARARRDRQTSSGE
jgi:hypothetical protein